MVLARGYLLADGYSIFCTPEFADVEIDGKVRTAIKLVVECHPVTVSENDNAAE